MFMRVSATQDFSICLRCQYCLSLRQRHRPRRRWPTGYPQQLRSFATALHLQQEPSTVHDVAIDDGVIGRAPIRYSSGALHEPPPPTKDSIGFNVLGKPAEVLILRDKKKRFKLDSGLTRIRASGPAENPTVETISSSEMLKKMDAERGLIDLDEVCKYIESLQELWVAIRKSSGSSAAYSKLVAKLEEGFTKEQLGAYFDRARIGLAADSFDLDVEFSSKSYARSSWQPLEQTPLAAGKTRAPKLEVVRVANLPEKDLSKKAPSRKDRLQKLSRQGVNKKTLVKLIVRECWNIRPRGQDPPVGQLDVRLRRVDLKLLLNHKRDILKLMSKSYDSKVEAWPQAPIVRITSDYDNCVDVIKILISAIKNIKVSTVDLDDDSVSRQSAPARGMLDNALLGQIEEYTNTLVEPVDKSFRAVRVSYLGPDDNDLLETRRLIYQILRPGCSHTTKLVWSKGDETSKPSLAPVLVGNRMSLLKRNQDWSRWCNPHDRDQVESEEWIDELSLSELLAAPSPGKMGADAVKSFFAMPDDTIYKHCKTHAPFWTPEIEYHDSVKFGQILFPTKLASSTADTIGKSKRDDKSGRTIKTIVNRDIGLGFMKEPREFVPLVPGLVQSLRSFGLLKGRDDLLQIRLSPSPKNLSLPVPVSALPDLEITVSFDDESKATSIEGVRLVNRLEKDFLQPERIVDLRFIREQHINARDDDIDPSITAFVQNSDLNLQGTELLKTPAGLSLSIPALAVFPHKGFVPEKHDTLLVDYTSLGLQLRSSLTIPYQEPDSWPTLTYTSIEAGRIEGRRDELSLNRVRFKSSSPPLNDLDFDPATRGNDTDAAASSHNASHTTTLFQKTAAVIETVERMGGKNGGGSLYSSLEMPELNRVRRMRERFIKKVAFGPRNEGHERIRKVIVDLLARPAGERKGADSVSDRGCPSAVLSFV